VRADGAAGACAAPHSADGSVRFSVLAGRSARGALREPARAAATVECRAIYTGAPRDRISRIAVSDIIAQLSDAHDVVSAAQSDAKPDAFRSRTVA
jgi:hypothetical protein